MGSTVKCEWCHQGFKNLTRHLDACRVYRQECEQKARPVIIINNTVNIQNNYFMLDSYQESSNDFLKAIQTVLEYLSNHGDSRYTGLNVKQIIYLCFADSFKGLSPKNQDYITCIRDDQLDPEVPVESEDEYFKLKDKLVEDVTTTLVKYIPDKPVVEKTVKELLQAGT